LPVSFHKLIAINPRTKPIANPIAMPTAMRISTPYRSAYVQHVTDERMVVLCKRRLDAGKLRPLP
jgi:hypothetical protein